MNSIQSNALGELNVRKQYIAKRNRYPTLRDKPYEGDCWQSGISHLLETSPNRSTWHRMTLRRSPPASGSTHGSREFPRHVNGLSK
jgi:hypothetical protein